MGDSVQTTFEGQNLRAALMVAAGLPSSTGVKTAADSMSVVPASDAAFNVPFTRNVTEQTGTLALSSAYLINQAMGTLITVNLGAAFANTPVLISRFGLAMPVTGAAAASAAFLLPFNAAPSTIANGVVPAFVAADAVKNRYAATLAVTNLGSLAVFTGATNGDIVADANGRIYLVVIAGGTMTFNTADTAAWVLNLRY